MCPRQFKFAMLSKGRIFLWFRLLAFFTNALIAGVLLCSDVPAGSKVSLKFTCLSCL